MRTKNNSVLFVEGNNRTPNINPCAIYILIGSQIQQTSDEFDAFDPIRVNYPGRRQTLTSQYLKRRPLTNTLMRSIFIIKIFVEIHDFVQTFQTDNKNSVQTFSFYAQNNSMMTPVVAPTSIVPMV